MDTAEHLIDKATNVCGGLNRLGDRIHENPSFLSRIRTGKKQISPGIAGKLAAILGADPREAACAALVINEQDPDKRAELAALFGFDPKSLNDAPVPRNL